MLAAGRLCILLAVFNIVGVTALFGMSRLRPRPQSASVPVPNTTRYFPGQMLDHFNAQDTRTWRQRYFVNETFFDRATGPVFLCVGGEGPPLEPTVGLIVIVALMKRLW